MVKCPKCGEEMVLTWDPYGKYPPRFVCFNCGYIMPPGGRVVQQPKAKPPWTETTGNATPQQPEGSEQY